jgi:hypothetical protein
MDNHLYQNVQTTENNHSHVNPRVFLRKNQPKIGFQGYGTPFYGRKRFIWQVSNQNVMVCH